MFFVLLFNSVYITLVYIFNVFLSLVYNSVYWSIQSVLSQSVNQSLLLVVSRNSTLLRVVQGTMPIVSTCVSLLHKLMYVCIYV